MSVIIKSTEMNYKDPTTGEYTGINVLAEKKTSEFLDAIDVKGETVISDIPASYDDLNNIIAESYDATKTYNIGDCVRYYDGTNDKLYKCIVSTENDSSWVDSHWVEVVACNEISAISEGFDAAAITEDLSLTGSGVTINSINDTLQIYGTASAARRVCFLNGQNSIKTTTSSFAMTLEAGTYIFTTDQVGYESKYLIEGTYTTFANKFTIASSAGKETVITFTDPVMIAYTTIVNRNYGTSENPTYFSINIKKVTAVDLVARDAIENLDVVDMDTLYKYNFYDAIECSDTYEPGYTRTTAGVTYVKNVNGSWTVTGTATSNNAFTNLIAYSLEPTQRYIIPGRKYKCSFNGGHIPIRIYFYYGEQYDTYIYDNDFEIVIPLNITKFTLRFEVLSGTTVNETVKYSFIPETVTSIDNYYTYNNEITKETQEFYNTYNITASPQITTDTNGWLQAVDTDSSDETGKTDMAPAIMTMLNATGYCHLGEGIFYISGNIDMPEKSMLCGCGNKTIIRLLSSVSSGYCIKISATNTISDLSVSGGYSAPSHSTEGTRNGILFQANCDGTEGATQYTTVHCMMNNIWVSNFSGSGIKCHNTSQIYRHGLHAINVICTQCWCGLNIDYLSEFNKFTHLLTGLCTIGCINNGGNNVFTACTFYGTTIAFYVDGTQTNSAHSTINGCTFCHSGSNSGSAITMENVTAGFIISSSQIWYNSIDLDNCTGIAFIGCEFGRGTTSGRGAKITINGGNLVLFNGCLFMNDENYPPEITITNNSKVHFSACYGSASGEPIEVS